jgi:phage baseplate assembly protein W
VSTAPKTYGVIGTDLALTRYTGVSGSAPLDSADSWGTVDLRVVPGGRGGLALGVTDPLDLATVSARDNLGQAIVMRLLTVRGSLGALGHPDYGSRLMELIGRVNNDTTRNLARLYTIEAIAQERRVTSLLDLAVTPVPGQPNTIAISFSVIPVDDLDPLALTLEVTL